MKRVQPERRLVDEEERRLRLVGIDRVKLSRSVGAQIYAIAQPRPVGLRSVQRTGDFI